MKKLWVREKKEWHWRPQAERQKVSVKRAMLGIEEKYYRVSSAGMRSDGEKNETGWRSRRRDARPAAQARPAKAKAQAAEMLPS